MKKILLTLLGVVLVATSLKGQTTRIFDFSFALNEFDVKYDSIGRFFITSEKYKLAYDASNHNMPYIVVNLIIDPFKEYKTHLYTGTESVIKSNVRMPKFYEPITTKSQTVSSISEETRILMRTSVLRYKGQYDMDGYRFITFYIYPFIYDYETKKISLYSQIHLYTTLRNSSSPTTYYNSLYHNNIGKNMRQNIYNLIYNKSELNELYDFEEVPDTTRERYLIITNEQLKPFWNELAQWKRIKGYQAEILTTEEINQIEGEDIPLKIKTALRNLYRDSDNGLKYVLLGGDETIVPAKMCIFRRADYKISEVPEIWVDSISYTPSDLYYGCFDNTFNWDANHNGISGEFHDSIDLTPEIWVTRIPISNAEECQNVVKRIIDYERGYQFESWEPKMLLCGSRIGNNDTIYDEMGHIYRIRSDAEVWNDRMYTEFIAPYWTGDITRFYDSHTDFDLIDDGDFHLNADNLQNVLQQGFSFVNITSHGWFGEWQLELMGGVPIPNYKKYHAASLHNPSYTFITTSSCCVNGFDQDTLTLGETLIRNPHGNIIAFVGNSREGYSSGNINVISNADLFNSVLYRILFSKTAKHYGEIVGIALLETPSLSPNSVFGLNPLGDPEMPIYTSSPKDIQDISISLYNNNLLVDCPDSCNIYVTNRDSLTSFYAYSKKNTNSCSINLPKGCYILCLLKAEHKPFVRIIFNQDIIQDEIISDDAIISGNNINIGSNITTLKPEGDVIISSKRTNVVVSDSVTITGGFEVKQGAEFEIRTNN